MSYDRPDTFLIHPDERIDDLSDNIIRLSVSSEGNGIQAEKDELFRRYVLTDMGSGRRYFGYHFGSLESSSYAEYLLTTDEIIEDDCCCFSGECCTEVTPSLEDLSICLLATDGGSTLIEIVTIQEKVKESTSRFWPVIRIVINEQLKGTIQLDYPSSLTDTGLVDTSLPLTPVAITDRHRRLLFIFRSSPAQSSDPASQVTDIITADGTGFVVAKVGAFEAFQKDGELKNDGAKSGRDHFCLRFLDPALAKSRKELIFNASIVFFYQWLVKKAFGKKIHSKPQPGSRCSCIIL